MEEKIDNTEVAPEISEAPVGESQPEAVEAPEEPQALQDESQAPAEEPQQVPQEPEGQQPVEVPSRREQLRVQKLLEKMKQQPRPQMPAPQATDYRQMIDAPEEVYQQLEADRQAYGQSAAEAAFAQNQSLQFHTRVELDVPNVESKYPQFKEGTPEHNPVLADTINNWYLTTVGYDPQTGAVQNLNVRYSEFVEGIMEIAEMAAGEKVAKSSKNIARQAAATGLRPDGSTTKKLNLDKAPEDMTDEELNAVISANGLASKKRR